MGAWGEGMQANDSALDAIDTVKAAKLDLRTEKDQREAFILAGSVWGSERPNDEVLGLAEWMMDEGITLCEGAKRLVKATIEDEMKSTDKRCWTEPHKRVAALQRFEARLLGLPYDKAKTEEDNMPLLYKAAILLDGKRRKTTCARKRPRSRKSRR